MKLICPYSTSPPPPVYSPNSTNQPSYNTTVFIISKFQNLPCIFAKPLKAPLVSLLNRINEWAHYYRVVLFPFLYKTTKAIMSHPPCYFFSLKKVAGGSEGGEGIFKSTCCLPTQPALTLAHLLQRFFSTF